MVEEEIYTFLKIYTQLYALLINVTIVINYIIIYE